MLRRGRHAARETCRLVFLNCVLKLESGEQLKICPRAKADRASACSHIRKYRPLEVVLFQDGPQAAAPYQELHVFAPFTTEVSFTSPPQSQRSSHLSLNERKGTRA